MTYNLSVNAMAYLAPVVSLGWLLAFSLIGEVFSARAGDV